MNTNHLSRDVARHALVLALNDALSDDSSFLLQQHQLPQSLSTDLTASLLLDSLRRQATAPQWNHGRITPPSAPAPPSLACQTSDMSLNIAAMAYFDRSRHIQRSAVAPSVMAQPYLHGLNGENYWKAAAEKLITSSSPSDSVIRKADDCASLRSSSSTTESLSAVDKMSFSTEKKELNCLLPQQKHPKDLEDAIRLELLQRATFLRLQNQDTNQQQQQQHGEAQPTLLQRFLIEGNSNFTNIKSSETENHPLISTGGNNDSATMHTTTMSQQENQQQQQQQQLSRHVVGQKSPEARVDAMLNTVGSTLRRRSDPFIDCGSLGHTLEQSAKDHGMRTGGGIGLPSKNATSGGVSEPFPEKLYRMLQEAEEQGFSDVVSFYPHGRAFGVHQVDRFVKEIMPKYFASQTKWASFTRQLNLWGFLRVMNPRSPDVGGYYHELFLYGLPHLTLYMKRVNTATSCGSTMDRRKFKAKYNSVGGSAGDAGLTGYNDPDFYTMKPLGERE